MYILGHLNFYLEDFFKKLSNCFIFFPLKSKAVFLLHEIVVCCFLLGKKNTGLVFHSMQNWFSHTHNPLLGIAGLFIFPQERRLAKMPGPNRVLHFQGRHLIYAAFWRKMWSWPNVEQIFWQSKLEILWLTALLPTLCSASNASEKRIITLKKHFICSLAFKTK